MGTILRITLAPVHWVFIFLTASCFAISSFTARLRYGDEMPDIKKEQSVKDEVDEDDDWLRQWWNDLGPEDRATLVQAGFSKLSFVPEKPFIPWWITMKRRKP